MDRERILEGIAGNLPRAEYALFDSRRPSPTINAREVSLPSGVVIDASSWGVTNDALACRAEGRAAGVLGGPFNPYSGTIDVMINPDGSVLSTTIYSTPASAGLQSSFYHFWLAERTDVYPPTYTVNNGVITRIFGNGLSFTLPMPAAAISQVLGSTTYTPNAYSGLVAATPQFRTCRVRCGS